MTSLVAALALIAACSTPPAPPPTARGGLGAPIEMVDPDAQLVTSSGIAGEPRAIDPHVASTPSELEVARNVWEGLLVLDPATLRPSPATAETLPTISADGKTFTFTLRPGLTYSDGASLTAADFAFGYARACDPRTRSDPNTLLFVIVGCEQLATMDASSATPAELDAARAKLAVRALNDRQIEFTTIEAAPYFPAITTFLVGVPLRRADVERGESWTQPGTYVGNGPFKLVSWDRGQAIVFERNERYRMPVKLKSWKMVMLQDRTVEFAGYKSDQIHIVDVTTEQMRAVEADPVLRVELTKLPTSGATMYVFNTARPPFEDPMVRLAFAKALDRADFVQKIFGGIGRPADGGFIPFGNPGYDRADTAQSFDVSAAKRLLAQSSYGGVLPPVTLSIWSTAVNSLNVQWARAQWRANLGVEVTVEPIENQVYQQLILSPDTAPQIFYTGVSLGMPDPYSFQTAWGPGGLLSTRGGYASDEFSRSIGLAATTTDPTRAADLYRDAGRRLSEDAPAVWLAYGERAALVKPQVKGLRPSAQGLTALGKHEIYLTKESVAASSATPSPVVATPTRAPIPQLPVFVIPIRTPLPTGPSGPGALSFSYLAPPPWTVGTEVNFSFCDPAPASPTDACGPGTIEPTGGKPPYTFTYAPPERDSLPSGLTFHTNGLVTGSPTTAMLFTVDVCVKDAAGASTCTRIYGVVNADD